MRQKYSYLLFLELVLLSECESSVAKTLCFLVKGFVIMAENNLLSVFKSGFDSLSSSFSRSCI